MDQSQIIAGKPVAVIGAGLSGLVAAKHLAAEGFQVTVYERRSQAVYGDLQTNFPRRLMELQDYPWTSQPLFMQHDLVHEYLAGYAQDIQQKCNSRIQFHFDTKVVRLFHKAYAGGHWELTWESVLTAESGTSQFLYVIVAIGLYDEPSIPDYEGLATWRELWRNSVSHAKSHRNPDAFRGKNVLIVGYQASGFDIASKISTYVSKLWISSTRPLAGGLPANALPMKGVSRFLSSPPWVTFTDGQTLVGVDRIIFCTGYQYHQPFIKKSRNTAEPLFPSGSYIKRFT
ncbi:hypothetical protein INS49_012558 [Diaporthe citri]|uniref:uncharacterized protein n=1 Tax=Diaporthe citri TaxID=83186 RepID=UPI001C80B990|nr:uncharacterized protein INS49_012558 [Diaporthe citri]KAG6359038.1 hypothetical protein INS49_012558 [Diaporthe citri]